MEISTLARNIRRIRLGLGLSQAALVRLSGCKSVAMIETGYRISPHYQTIVKIAAALGVEAAELYAQPRKRTKRG